MRQLNTVILILASSALIAVACSKRSSEKPEPRKSPPSGGSQKTGDGEEGRFVGSEPDPISRNRQSSLDPETGAPGETGSSLPPVDHLIIGWQGITDVVGQGLVCKTLHSTVRLGE